LGKDAVEGFLCLIVHRDPSFIVEFFKWDMKRPLVSAQMTHGVRVQAKTFTHTHAREADHNEGICEEVVDPSQLVGEELIDFGGKGFGKIKIARREILEKNEPMGYGISVVSQIVEKSPHADESGKAGPVDEGWILLGQPF